MAGQTVQAEVLAHHVGLALRFLLMDRALGWDDLVRMVQQLVCNHVSLGLCASCWVQDDPATYTHALNALCYWCANEPPMRSLMDNARTFLIGR